MKQKVTLIVTAAVSSFVLIGLGEVAFSSLGSTGFFLPVETPQPFPSVFIDVPSKQAMAMEPEHPTIQPVPTLDKPMASATMPPAETASDPVTNTIADKAVANSLAPATTDGANVRTTLISYKYKPQPPVDKPSQVPTITKPPVQPPVNKPSDQPTITTNRPRDTTPEHNPRDDHQETQRKDGPPTNKPEDDSSDKQSGDHSHVTEHHDNAAPAREHEDHH